MSTLEAQLKWREQERKRVYNTVGFIRNAPVIFMVREAVVTVGLADVNSLTRGYDYGQW